MKKLSRVLSLVLVVVLLGPALPVRAVDYELLGLSTPSLRQAVGSSTTANKVQSASDQPLESPIDPQSYRLGPGDTLAIHLLLGDAQLSVDHFLTIGADGKLFFPNIGEIDLSGLSLAEAKTRIDRLIRSNYKDQYKLFVNLNQPKKVKIYLTGMIKTPGPMAVYDNSRVSEVIELADGVTSGGSRRYAYIHRRDEQGNQTLLKADIFEAYRSRDLAKDIRIQAGDVVEIPDSANELISKIASSEQSEKLLYSGKETFVYVYGEVRNGGRYEFVPGRRLSDYISYAGGPTARALLGDVSVTRQVNGKPQRLKINAGAAIYGGNEKQDIEIMGGDVIGVPGNFFYVADFSSFVNTILLGLSLYTSVTRL
ncbi:MAG: SLBB domain-containing protein [Candidatus Margulisiibacteriota bacterium]